MGGHKKPSDFTNISTNYLAGFSLIDAPLIPPLLAGRFAEGCGIGLYIGYGYGDEVCWIPDGVC
jgi:hypothetical protein